MATDELDGLAETVVAFAREAKRLPLAPGWEWDKAFMGDEFRVAVRCGALGTSGPPFGPVDDMPRLARWSWEASFRFNDKARGPAVDAAFEALVAQRAAAIASESPAASGQADQLCAAEKQAAPEELAPGVAALREIESIAADLPPGWSLRVSARCDGVAVEVGDPTGKYHYRFAGLMAAVNEARRLHSLWNGESR